MTAPLPPSANVARPGDGPRLHAPAAARNTAPLTDLLLAHAPATGRALELASGTGQHVCAFARALPGLSWQPTEPDPARRASIDAHAADAGLPNIAPARALDATRPGWGEAMGPVDLILLINLLHLIDISGARTLVSEAARALAPAGKLILYGPFSRAGQLTSEGDRRFDAELRAADPTLGYKDDLDIRRWLGDAGLTDRACVEMPANNLAFVAQKPDP